MKHGKGIELADWHAPDYADTDDIRCVSVYIPDTDEHLAILAALLDLPTHWFNFTGEISLRRRQADMWKVAFAADLWEDCMACCDDILAALEALSEKVDNVQDDVNDLKDTQANNTAANPTTEQSSETDAICGGAAGVVAAMHTQNLNLYEQTEGSLADQALELLPDIVTALAAVFGTLATAIATMPFDALFGMAEQIFEHQVDDYKADFPVVQDMMIADLSCLIQDNGNEFTFEVWGAWLDGLDHTYPGNAAASLFARYSPLRQSFLNQIFAQINKNASLEVYFDTLASAYSAGLTVPVTCTGSCSWTYEFDSTNLPDFVVFTDTPDGRWGHISGTTITSDTRHVDLGGFKDIGGIAFQVTLPTAKNITQLKVEQLTGSGIEGSSIVNEFYDFRDVDNNSIGGGALPQQNDDWIVDDTDGWTGVKVINVQYLFYLTPAVCTWHFTLSGSGVSPFPVI